jgi:hypothetical protein
MAISVCSPQALFLRRAGGRGSSRRLFDRVEDSNQDFHTSPGHAQPGQRSVTFQVIRRTIATLGKTKGHPKDIQGLMRHSRLATTMEVYMQSLQKEVRKAINSIHDELMATGTNGSGPQPPTVPEGRTDLGVKARGRGLTMERQRKQKGEDREKKMPSRCKILPFAGKMRANGLEDLR